MPYPQFLFARRNDTTSQPQAGKESEPAAQTYCSDRIEPAELGATRPQKTRSAPKRESTASKPTSTASKPPKIVSLSSSLPRTQPIDIPQSSQPGEITRPTSGHPPRYTYNCMVCWKEHEPPCYTIGPESRIVCLDCWRWIYSVSICWKCNEVVYRKEDAISFGWC
jgi:hypothetical protein